MNCLSGSRVGSYQSALLQFDVYILQSMLWELIFCLEVSYTNPTVRQNEDQARLTQASVPLPLFHVCMYVHYLCCLPVCICACMTGSVGILGEC